MVLLLALSAGLCACGGKQSSAEADLTAQNEALQAELDDLKEQYAALQAESGAAASGQDDTDNPIDAFFEAAGEKLFGTTVELNLVAAMCADAWKDEVYHLAEELKASLYFDEDRERVDRYLAAVEEQVEQMDAMVLFVCGDTQVSPEERLMTSGTIRGVLWGSTAATAYKNAFYQLKSIDPDSYWEEKDIVWSFDSAKAEKALEEALR